MAAIVSSQHDSLARYLRFERDTMSLSTPERDFQALGYPWLRLIGPAFPLCRGDICAVCGGYVCSATCDVTHAPAYYTAFPRLLLRHFLTA